MGTLSSTRAPSDALISFLGQLARQKKGARISNREEEEQRQFPVKHGGTYFRS